jgi:hypothetical protein
VQQYPQGKYSSKHGFKTLIKLSQQSQSRQREQLKKIVSTQGSATQTRLICHLNPVITGWCQYYSTVVSKEAIASMDLHLFGQLWRWAKHRHPRLNSHRIVSRYWLVNQGKSWIFQNPDGFKLRRHNLGWFHPDETSDIEGVIGFSYMSFCGYCVWLNTQFPTKALDLWQLLPSSVGHGIGRLQLYSPASSLAKHRGFGSCRR